MFFPGFSHSTKGRMISIDNHPGRPTDSYFFSRVGWNHQLYVCTTVCTYNFIHIYFDCLYVCIYIYSMYILIYIYYMCIYIYTHKGDYRCICSDCTVLMCRAVVPIEDAARSRVFFRRDREQWTQPQTGSFFSLRLAMEPRCYILQHDFYIPVYMYMHIYIIMLHVYIHMYIIMKYQGVYGRPRKTEIPKEI